MMRTRQGCLSYNGQAFREGNLGIMDYYRMKNLAADTDMRSKIAGGEDNTGMPDKS